MADNLPARQQRRSPQNIKLPKSYYQTYNTRIINNNQSPGGAGSSAPSGGGRGPRTEYVYLRGKGTGGGGGKGMAGLLGNREVLFGAWVVAMGVVSWDEWKNYGILPRPARLWYTTLLYGLLAVLSVVDALVPLANAIAIAFVITLLYQYYNHSGQFADSGSPLTASLSAGVAAGITSGLSGITNSALGALSGVAGAITGNKSAPSGPAPNTSQSGQGHPLQAG